jgi:hypothetical protein
MSFGRGPQRKRRGGPEFCDEVQRPQGVLPCDAIRICRMTKENRERLEPLASPGRGVARRGVRLRATPSAHVSSVHWRLAECWLLNGQRNNRILDVLRHSLLSAPVSFG